MALFYQPWPLKNMCTLHSYTLAAANDASLLLTVWNPTMPIYNIRLRLVHAVLIVTVVKKAGTSYMCVVNTVSHTKYMAKHSHPLFEYL